MKTFTPKPADLTHDWYVIDATDVVLGRLAYAELLEKNPERIIKNAVKGMLPKNRLAKVQLDRLRIFRGAEHPHTPQKPQVFEIAQVSQQAK